MGGNGGCCCGQVMAKKKKSELDPLINGSVWLKDEERFTVLRNLEHTPRPGEILDVEGQLWRVVEWTNRIEGERVVS